MLYNSFLSIKIYRTESLVNNSSINITSLSWLLLVKRNRSPAIWWASCSSSLSLNYKWVHQNYSVSIIIFFNILLLPRLMSILDFYFQNGYFIICNHCWLPGVVDCLHIFNLQFFVIWEGGFNVVKTTKSHWKFI